MRLTCTINGEPREVDGLWEGESLLYVLRERLQLPGSKNACEQGECGSCSVYLDGVLVCSCLVAAGQAEGREVVTVEGLAARGRAAPGPGGVPRGGRGAVRVLHAGADRRDARPAGAQAVAVGCRDPRGAGRQPVPLHGLREDPRRGPAGGFARMIIEGCAVATVSGAVYRDGHVVIEGNRITAVGPGPARGGEGDADRRVRVPRHARADQLPPPPLPARDARAGAAGDAVRVAGRAVPGVGADRRARRARRGARRARGAAAVGLHDRLGPSLRLPARRGDLLAVEVEAARELGIRFHPCRGAMDLGVSHGRAAAGLAWSRTATRSSPRTTTRWTRFHDPSPGSMCRIALAPCSPFSVTRELMAETADVRPRARRAAAHAHGRDGRGGGVLPRAVRRAAGRVPRGARVARRRRLARALRAPRPSARSRGSARRGTGVAHCPSSNARLGAGIAPVVPLVRAGAPVGLGVDGAASNEAGELGGELRQALLVARLRGGPAAMTARRGAGARHAARRALPRPRRRARHAGGRQAAPTSCCGGSTISTTPGIEDPVAALVLGPRPLARDRDRRRRGRGRATASC